MSTVLELLGIDEKINARVEKCLSERGLSFPKIRDMIEEAVDAYKADVYSNMQTIEEQKYKLIELEIQLNNLTEMVKILERGGG